MAALPCDYWFLHSIYTVPCVQPDLTLQGIYRNASQHKQEVGTALSTHAELNLSTSDGRCWKKSKAVRKNLHQWSRSENIGMSSNIRSKKLYLCDKKQQCL